VHVSRLRTRDGEPALYNTALQFLGIDERDRDAVVKFVSSAQLEHLRTMRRGNTGTSDPHPTGHTRNVRRQRIIFAVVLIAFISTILTGLVLFRLKSDKGEIEQTYEREIKKYRSVFPWR
jgi:hypothetical protein